VIDDVNIGLVSGEERKWKCNPWKKVLYLNMIIEKIKEIILL